MSDLIENRQIRIFISSTFKDMQDERSHLVQKTFPALRKYCAEREISLQELDLRWGIRKEESEQGKVVDICLKEIKKTMPFFIGLLGDRYGWVPEKADLDKIGEKSDVYTAYPWVRDELEKNGTSITEIEIQEGVLRAKTKVNAYFYFRSPAMDVPDNADFREAPGSPASEKLERLKSTLRGQKTYPVAEYDSIKHLGDLVERDFKELADALFPKVSFSALKKERLEQATFLKSKTIAYVGDEELVKQIDEFVSGETACLVVKGESGAGKSALLANWIKSRERRDDEKIIYHFVGQSMSQGDHRKITARLINELKDIYSLEDPPDELEQLKAGEDKQQAKLQNLLAGIRDRGPLIIILEGLDKLSDSAGAKLLNWLPGFPSNVKFIFSTRKGDKTTDYFTRMEYPVVEMKPLSEERIKTLIPLYLNLYGKNLNGPQIERIARDPENSNPLALCTLLDELRMFGVHEKLDEKIDWYLKAESIPALFELVLGRLEENFNYGKENFVKNVLSLLWVSRNGLSEDELSALTGSAPLYRSQLFNGLESHLLTRNGLLTFSNGYIREAVESRYLNTDESKREYRLKLAKFFTEDQSAIANRKNDEVPYQLFELGEWDELYRLLLDFNVFEYLSTKESYELVKYWHTLIDRDKARYSIERYLAPSTLARSKAKMGELFYNLSELASYVSEVSIAIAFARKAVEELEEAYGKNNIKTAEAYAVLGRIGIPNTEERLDYCLKALDIYRNILGEKHIATALAYFSAGSAYAAIKWQKEIEKNKAAECLLRAVEIEGPESHIAAISYNQLAMYSANDPDVAREYAQKALKAAESSLGKNHPKMALIYFTLSVLCTLHDDGDYDKAAAYAEQSLAITRSVYGENSFAAAIGYQALGNAYLMGLCKKPQAKKEEFFDKCRDYTRMAIDISSKVLGEQNEFTAAALLLLGGGYEEIKDWQNALDVTRKAYNIYREVLGENHSQTKAARDVLAGYYMSRGGAREEKGDCEGAIADFSAAIEIDPNNSAYFMARSNAYMNTWDMEKSIADSTEAIRLRSKGKA
ncbi:MAG: tetratricopeptide repeat protein [Spirochaetales bacterium]|jgi:tetratricopeptide (TPR) repeat protein|nr:tetratricopeptide repeat protein [Spirochaetales bacterium]